MRKTQSLACGVADEGRSWKKESEGQEENLLEPKRGDVSSSDLQLKRGDGAKGQG